MPLALVGESAFPLHRLESADGLAIRFLPDGCIYSIEHDGILINQVCASPVAGGIGRVWLRVIDGSEVRLIEVIGPGSAAAVSRLADRVIYAGEANGLQYDCTVWLDPQGGTWLVQLSARETGVGAVVVDAVMVQDVGLGVRGHVRNNELFCSQYIDHKILSHHDLGSIAISRQNLPQGTRGVFPSLMLGCLPRGRVLATDGFDLLGAPHRADRTEGALTRPAVDGRVRQYESACIGVAGEAVLLDRGEVGRWTFFANYTPDHPEPTDAHDRSRVDAVLRSRAAFRAVRPQPAPATLPARSVFAAAPMLTGESLSPVALDRVFPPGSRRHEERVGGQVYSFFTGDDARHVVTVDREAALSRPHGHILRAGRGHTPDAPLLSVTCYAAGIFASQLTVGNTSLCKVFSAVRDPLNMVRSNGLRVFVRHDRRMPWRLLGVPSTFEMSLDACRWRYCNEGGWISVLLEAEQAAPRMSMRVESSSEVELLLVGEISAGPSEYDTAPNVAIDADAGRIEISPASDSMIGRAMSGLAAHLELVDPSVAKAIGGDELLYSHRTAYGFPYVVIQTHPTRLLELKIKGVFGQTNVTRSPATHEGDAWSHLTAGVKLHCAGEATVEVQQLQDTLTWFARDAMLHLATPRGLEQPNGGAWGVRDVCQGPVEFLLSYGHTAEVRDIVCRVFAQQYDRRGDWPQWFMFPPFASIQSTHCHGDVVMWPLKALCDYLEHSNDGSILEEPLPYTDDTGFAPTSRRETLLAHVDRLVEKVRRDFAPGLNLPRYGDGDWDDSLQPAEPPMRERMVSSWTSALLYQTLRRWSEAAKRFGHVDRAVSIGSLADALKVDFERHLLPGGTVAGFALFDGQTPVEYLLHPSDTRTGLKYRLIPMTRGIIAGVFSPEQAERHLALVREHLLFPDGARLMDRPTTYAGGVERTFRRSESAACFGREIGLQYVHAHLRYAEALARMGRAEELWHALLVANPIAVTDVVPNAQPRQRNCYFSSSDAAFSDRYEAARHYDKLRRGEVAVDGGWRIYSSGPGIYSSLVVRHLFGLRRFYGAYEFDPVLPASLNHACISLRRGDQTVVYQVALGGGTATGPTAVVVNGQRLTDLQRVDHPYRRGGVRVPESVFEGALRPGDNHVRIEI